MKNPHAIPSLTRITSEIEAMEEAAYQRGWDDAIKAITAAANAKRIDSVAQDVENDDDESSENGEDSTGGRKLKPGSLIETVYITAKAIPGRTRIELINAMQANGIKFNEESAKTSIKRLVRWKMLEDKERRLY